MQRRTLLKAAGASAVSSLSSPAIVRAAQTNTLRFIPQLDLAFLDPVYTAAYSSRNHGYLVFDTLYGMSTNFEITPQMLEGHSVEDDGLLWTLRLRDGLVWHDGERVLARDCVASIRRWAKRDVFGDALMQATDEFGAADDRTIRFRLKRPFPLLPYALGKTAAPMCAMMPERLASTDPFKQIMEITGSGPFRFRADERVAGARNVYERFGKYRPRDGGAPNWTSGPKIVHYDRVEWNTMPDTSTATSALQAGEQDWQEYAPHDMLPLLRRASAIKVEVLDPTGMVSMLQVNHLQPPFDNPAIRRAVLGAIDQSSTMQAIVGNDASMYRTPLGYFCPGTPMASDVGLEPLTGPRDYGRVRDELSRAGYAGEKVVILVPGDSVTLKALGDVAADSLQQAGMNVDYLALDWGSMLTRRNRKDPVETGGWSAFVTSWAGTDWLNPAGHLALRTTGETGYPGWCSSPRIEGLRQAWLTAPDMAAQREICRDIQRQAMTDVPFYPLGNYVQPTAYRTSLSGVLKGFPVFWNVRPS